MPMLEISVIQYCVESAGNARTLISREFHGNIGKSKSNHFEGDKFLATSKYELSEQSCPLLLRLILFVAEAVLQSRHCRRADDNDSTKLEKPQLAN